MVKYTSDIRELNRRYRQSARDRSAGAVYYATTYAQYQVPATTTATAVEAVASSPMSYYDTIDEESSTKLVEKANTHGFAALFNTSKYADVTLYLGPQKFEMPAHRVVLGMQSPYFEGAFNNGFKENETSEFHFDKDSAHALWRAFNFMYTGDYSDEPASALSGEEVQGAKPVERPNAPHHVTVDELELLKHPRVFALADIFCMDHLKALACEKFSKQLAQLWISDTFPDCIREVYSTTIGSDKQMRRAIIDVIKLHYKEICQKAAFAEIYCEIGEFTVDLVNMLAGLD